MYTYMYSRFKENNMRLLFTWWLHYIFRVAWLKRFLKNVFQNYMKATSNNLTRFKTLLIFYWHWPILSGLQVSKQQKQRHFIVIRQHISSPGWTRTASACWPSLIAVDFTWELDEEEPNQLTKQCWCRSLTQQTAQQIQINCDISEHI